MDIDALANYVNSELQKRKLLDEAKDFISDIQGLAQYKKENEKVIADLKKEQSQVRDDAEKEQLAFKKARDDFNSEIEKIKGNALTEAGKIRNEALSAAEQMIDKAKKSDVVAEISAKESELEKVTLANVNAGNSLANLNNQIKEKQAQLNEINLQIEKTKKMFGA